MSLSISWAALLYNAFYIACLCIDVALVHSWKRKKGTFYSVLILPNWMWIKVVMCALAIHQG